MMDQPLHDLPRNKSFLPTTLLMAVDALALSLALFFAFYLRFDAALFENLQRYLVLHRISCVVSIPLYLALFAAFRLYRHAWRFASIEMVWGVIIANTFGVIGFAALQMVFRGVTMPRSVLIIFWILGIMLVGGARILLRLANLGRVHGRSFFRMVRRDTSSKRVVILGGGWDGARLLRALYDDVEDDYQVIGFLDDHPEKQGLFIRGVRVLGPLTHLYTLLSTNAVDEVLIAIPEARGADLRQYVMACRTRGIPVKVIPGLYDVLRGTARPRLEAITVEDLLRRQPVCLDPAEVKLYVTDKRVLVTGAGGSIGSELCRQLLAMEPSALILLGHGENSIHQIYQELCANFPTLSHRLSVVIASVADVQRLEHVFATLQPQVVFHAAAHKHVPIMELNVPEAVQNNVYGTHVVADACGRHHVERMVLISTDKAVLPSSVMGATKWLCEEVVRTLSETYPATTYVTVRFGNVLGSRGSVVPIFKEQIRRGGPVTITHAEMTRYFMTIPEAVTLVLHAGAIGESGELYLLDMGEPVKIVDLACDMICLSGLTPDKDIKIVFTGLRPGEKLHEQLVMDSAKLRPSKCERMSVLERTSSFRPSELRETLSSMHRLVANNDTDAVLDYFATIVPGFAERERHADMADEQPTADLIEALT